MKSNLLYVAFFVLCFVLTSRPKSFYSRGIEGQEIKDILSKKISSLYILDTTGKLKESGKISGSIYQVNPSTKMKPADELIKYLENIKNNETFYLIIVGDDKYTAERYGNWISRNFSLHTYYYSSPEELNSLL